MNPHFVEAWRCVSLGKLEAFAEQCEILAELADRGEVARGEAASELQKIAEANSLTDIFGHDYIADMIAGAFAPITAEAAE